MIYDLAHKPTQTLKEQNMGNICFLNGSLHGNMILFYNPY